MRVQSRRDPRATAPDPDRAAQLVEVLEDRVVALAVPRKGGRADVDSAVMPGPPREKSATEDEDEVAHAQRLVAKNRPHTERVGSSSGG
jgi:hypothetical protein